MAAIPPDAEFDPYAPPHVAESGECGTDSDDPLSAAVPRDRLHREAAVRALGLSCYLWGASFVVIPFALYLTKILRPAEMTESLEASLSRMGFIVAFSFALACSPVAVGRGLRRLRPLARWACIVILTLLLLNYLIGLVATWQETPRLVKVGFVLNMLALGPALGLLLSRSTAEVFAPSYREAVRQSPSLKPRLGFGGMVATWVSLSLLFGGNALLFIASIR